MFRKTSRKQFEENASAPAYDLFELPPPYSAGATCSNDHEGVTSVPLPSVASLPPSLPVIAPSTSALPPPPPGLPHTPYGQPISSQPTVTQGVAVVSWATTQTPLSSDPLGYLAFVDQLLVHQEEAVSGLKTKDVYHVRNRLGQAAFYAKAKSGCCGRNCCGTLRSFEMKVYDNFQRQALHLYRSPACDSCWFPCCLQTLEVSAPPDNVIGRVRQKWSIFHPSFAVENANGEVVYRVEGSSRSCSCCCSDVRFRITTADGKKNVGKIAAKQRSSVVKEAGTGTNHFGVTFPADMAVEMKAVMLGACFMIGSMYFENTGK